MGRAPNSADLLHVDHVTRLKAQPISGSPSTSQKTVATVCRDPTVKPHNAWRRPGPIGNEDMLPRVSRSDQHKRTRKVQKKSVCVRYWDATAAVRGELRQSQEDNLLHRDFFSNLRLHTRSPHNRKPHAMATQICKWLRMRFSRALH